MYLKELVMEDTPLARIEKKIDKIDQRVAAVEQKFAQWGGIVTGAVMAVSAIWGVVIAVWQFVKHKVS